MGETLNLWMNVSDAIVDASKTMTAGAGSIATSGASKLAVWSGAAQEGMEYTEAAMNQADQASALMTTTFGIDVPSVAPGTQIGIQASGLQWALAMANISAGVLNTGQAPQGEQAISNINLFVASIIEGALKCMTQAQLHGPISNAGAGFSVGSPFFHVVIIPFGDAKLNPLNQLK